MDMTIKRCIVFLLSWSVLMLTACAPAATETEVLPSPASPTETLTPIPTSTFVTPTVTDLSTLPTPTLVGSSNGVLIYDDTENILSINLDTDETKVLVSRSELEKIFMEDRSADSYTFGYDKPIAIELSPDLQKALITICASLDSRFRCVFENFVYNLQRKNAVRLPLPSDAYGMYWKWSPDNSKLAGASWGYSDVSFEVIKFYSVNSDGTDLKSIAPITNGHWQFAWHPGSQVILPLTFVTNFQSLFVDGSNQIDISLPTLQWNDKLECLAFSPDTTRVAFVLRRENPKDHDWVYVARSDFAELSPLTEYDIDARYTCTLAWSADQNLIHVGYVPDDRAETGVESWSPSTSTVNKVINLQTLAFVETPKNSQVCGWTPTGDLVYGNVDFSGAEAGIETVSLSGSEPSRLPDKFKATIRHCPLYWLDQEPALDIPVGLPVPNACVANVQKTDEVETEPFPALFDLLEVNSSLNGETLNVVMTFDAATADLNAYLTPEVKDFLNGWEVLVDVDNNALTGDRLGIEYRFSVVIKPGDGATPSAFGTAILGWAPAANTYEKAGTLEYGFDPNAKTLTFTGAVPGITENSRVVFLSRLVEQVAGGAPKVIVDRICE